MRDVVKWIVIGGIFILPCIPLMITHGMLFPFITGKNFSFRILVEIIFAAWILLALLDRTYRPKFSWIGVALLAFVAVIGIANVFGVAPMQSFWSNYERMEGYVTLLHIAAYFVVVASVMRTERLWNVLFNISLGVALIVGLYACAQLAGSIDIRQGGTRIDGTFGNAAYLAGYLLVHIFIALFMAVRTPALYLRIAYGASTLFFAFLLIQTATRGAVLGMVAGLLVTTMYIALFERKIVLLRKIAIGGLLALVLVTGGVFVAKDSAFVKNNEILNRVTSISLEAGNTRFTIWSIALEGARERPFLGWGQENFGHVFTKAYDPSLYAQEAWFDHVHNIFLDWLIAGGVLGLFGYVALLCISAWYAALRRVEADDISFSISERGIMLGLLAGYTVHNLVVFDNVVSYWLFATILAYLHYVHAREIPYFNNGVIAPQTVTRVVAPIVAVVVCVVIYTTNVPGMRAASTLIDALTLTNTALHSEVGSAAQRNELLHQGLDLFNTALAYNTFGTSEIREQLAHTARAVYESPYSSDASKQAYRDRAVSELHDEVQTSTQPARAYILLGGLHRAVGEYEASVEALEAARALSPRKQRTLLDLGATYMVYGQYDRALEVFAEALSYDTAYDDAREFYMAAAAYTGDEALLAELSAPPHDRLYYMSNRVLQAYYDTGNYTEAREIIERRIDQDPTNIQLRISKSVILHELFDTAGAIETLQQAIKDIPEFAPQGEVFIEQLRSGSIPRTGARAQQ